jgi:hypothetical protein
MHISGGGGGTLAGDQGLVPLHGTHTSRLEGRTDGRHAGDSLIFIEEM